MANIREEIARELAKYENVKWESLPDKATTFFTGTNKAELLRRADQITQLISQSLKPLNEAEMLQFIDRDKDRCKASECCAISQATVDNIKKELGL